ncbi:RTA1 domain protein [Aspergillus costaricaensis CBS 115574]|uniref:RTA1 domain protein n=1 Tax=Aspergillus costaricaensis CBS 115574 TaxID=1448317 RepID=A0ACD1I031_9EURO|nr:RTA1 domain protein [Aspergillus costaricaensis CBS 115574]RAK83841.1 RTA1 domain protein [Aspergillus costaricaensis CBS 115574]
MSTWNCYSFDPEVAPLLGYRPSITAGILFTVAFLGVLTTHVSQARNTICPWIGMLLSLGAAFEFIGWLARTLAYRCPYSFIIWMIQLSVLWSAPYFTILGIYGALDLVYAIIDRNRSPLRPKRWTDVCMTLACLSLIVQAIGLSLAYNAIITNSLDRLGLYILTAGCVVQLMSIGIFVVLFGYLIIQARHRLILRRPMCKNITVLAFALACTMIRSTYRLIELASEWQGYSFTYESLVCLFDGLPMLSANVVLRIWHPAVLLNEAMLMEARFARTEEVELRRMEDQNGRGSRLLDDYRPVSEELEPALRKR